ncbi:hypothetical protein DU002_01310 [Corallincola holothuriorum]|uniref:Uncharacterized protein n=1 Tax=Corallincola holothuriorum TaxID=2282215 RepID=A0A368NPZ3_9GAMM|nr:hypothetical protein [Corallincola holothuriorum]RCU52637.1 hypothetical protein DU002_01310 [Corallincola holothuriorum]
MNSELRPDWLVALVNDPQWQQQQEVAWQYIYDERSKDAPRWVLDGLKQWFFTAIPTAEMIATPTVNHKERVWRALLEYCPVQTPEGLVWCIQAYMPSSCYWGTRLGKHQDHLRITVQQSFLGAIYSYPWLSDQACLDLFHFIYGKTFQADRRMPFDFEGKERPLLEQNTPNILFRLFLDITAWLGDADEREVVWYTDLEFLFSFLDQVSPELFTEYEFSEEELPTSDMHASGYLINFKDYRSRRRRYRKILRMVANQACYPDFPESQQRFMADYYQRLDTLPAHYQPELQGLWARIKQEVKEEQEVS